APATHTTDHASWIGSWRRTGLLTELGHALDPTSPAGVVDGLASMGTPGSWADSTDLPVAVERFEEHTAPPRRTFFPLQRSKSRGRAARGRAVDTRSPAALAPASGPQPARVPRHAVHKSDVLQPDVASPPNVPSHDGPSPGTASPGTAPDVPATVRRLPVAAQIPLRPVSRFPATAPTPRRLPVLPAGQRAYQEIVDSVSGSVSHSVSDVVPASETDPPSVPGVSLLSAQRAGSRVGSPPPSPPMPGRTPAAPAAPAGPPAERPRTGAPVARAGLGAPLEPGERPWLVQRDECSAAQRQATSSPSAAPPSPANPPSTHGGTTVTQAAARSWSWRGDAAAPSSDPAGSDPANANGRDEPTHHNPGHGAVVQRLAAATTAHLGATAPSTLSTLSTASPTTTPPAPTSSPVTTGEPGDSPTRTEPARSPAAKDPAGTRVAPPRTSGAAPERAAVPAAEPAGIAGRGRGATVQRRRVRPLLGANALVPVLRAGVTGAHPIPRAGSPVEAQRHPAAAVASTGASPTRRSAVTTPNQTAPRQTGPNQTGPNQTAPRAIFVSPRGPQRPTGRVRQRATRWLGLRSQAANQGAAGYSRTSNTVHSRSTDGGAGPAITTPVRRLTAHAGRTAGLPRLYPTATPVAGRRHQAGAASQVWSTQWQRSTDGAPSGWPSTTAPTTNLPTTNLPATGLPSATWQAPPETGTARAPVARPEATAFRPTPRAAASPVPWLAPAPGLPATTTTGPALQRSNQAPRPAAGTRQPVPDSTKSTAVTQRSAGTTRRTTPSTADTHRSVESSGREPSREAGSTGSTGATQRGQTSQRDIDALARRLYGPIARRLRTELRLDRERAGRALDLEPRG
ncbi:MAG: hypothetical protein ACRDQ5_03030, partial [Sciscionella sp.]